LEVSKLELGPLFFQELGEQLCDARSLKDLRELADGFLVSLGQQLNVLGSHRAFQTLVIREVADNATDYAEGSYPERWVMQEQI
jgi:hypothetical protein